MHADIEVLTLPNDNEYNLLTCNDFAGLKVNENQSNVGAISSLHTY